VSIFLNLGLKRRLEGREYIGNVDEFMEVIHARWPEEIAGMYVVVILCLLTQSFSLSKLVKFHFEDIIFETLQPMVHIQ
jgi:hypothetical protein